MDLTDEKTLMLIALGAQVLASIVNTMVSTNATFLGIPVGKIINAIALGFGKAKPADKP